MSPQPTLTFTFIDQQGQEFEGTVVLKPKTATTGPIARRRGFTSQTKIAIGSNLRAFAKRYAKGRSGGRQFTLLVAFLAKGQHKVEVTTAEVGAAWRKVAGVLGGPFQSMYGTHARENDWIESPKRGVSCLGAQWESCLDDGTPND